MARCVAFLCIPVAAGLILLPRTVTAATMSLDIGAVQGAAWSAHGVSMQLVRGADGVPSVQLRADSVSFGGPLGTLEQVVVTCARPQMRWPRLNCDDAAISGRFGPLGRQRLRAAVAYDNSSGALNFRVRGLKLGGGAIAVTGQWRAEGWRAQVDARGLEWAALKRLAAPHWPALEALSVEGSGSLQATLRGADSLQSVQLRAQIEALTANNQAGTVATDKLGFTLEAQADASAAGWEVVAELHAPTGQAYADPVFVDLGQHPLSARLRGSWQVAESSLIVERLNFDQERIGRGSASGALTLSAEAPIERLHVQLDSLEFPGAYAVLMQPFLLDTELKELATSGSISGELDLVAGVPTALELALNGLTAQDSNGRLGIEDLSGRLFWESVPLKDEARTSTLSWKGANAYGLTGGGVQLQFIAAGADFQLLQPTLIPVLDGGLFIRTLRVRDMGAKHMSLRFEGDIRPIGMPLLCRAFGWPEFSGSLSGRIPQVSYEEGELSLGGALQISAFGGELTVDGLQLREPLGRYPRLRADVVMRGLNLQAVTSAFSFGTITGQLDGEIRDLELFRWTPIRMDARLYTPSGDKSRHRISQRAVQNLSNIGGGGGGVAAALQTGFLRFFENFRYSRLGLSCRLENEICYMDGVGPAKGDSYYIVKGSGLPRIDILGNSRRVDWPRLLEQLKSISESEGAVVR